MMKHTYLLAPFLLLDAIVSLAVWDPRFSYDVPCVPDIDMVSVETIVKKYKDQIGYQEFTPRHELYFNPIPFAPQEFHQYQPNHVTLAPTWVLTIPRGRVCSKTGYVFIDEKYLLRNLLCHAGWFVHQLNLLNWEKQNFKNPRKVSGRVAVITRLGAENYSHFMVDVLGRLAILEMMGVDYDWLYVPYNKPHIHQILTAWGIDPLKIIQPEGEFNYIEADELIVPSYTANLQSTPHVTYNHLVDLCAQYWPTWLTDYYRYKFLPLVQKTPIDQERFSKRVFISRKDSHWRVLINEDEVFALFEAHGFKRYVLSELTFLEQVALFNNAEIVVGAHGTAMCNMVFCSSDVKIVEIFQQRVDSCFAFLAQSLGLNYTPVKTAEFILHDRGGGAATIAPLDIIENIIKSLNL